MLRKWYASLHKQLSKRPLIIMLLRILEHSPLHSRHVPAFQWYHHPTCISHKHLGTNKHDLLQTATWINNRVHTDFWIQNSRLFPKHEHIFPDSRLSNRWSKETCKNAGPINTFSWCSANIWVKLNKIWPKWKKFTFKALVVALKKKLKTFYLFSRLYLHSPDFFQVWKTTGEISSLFLKNSRFCTNPVLITPVH